MENDIGVPDIAPRVHGNVTTYPGIPGPKGQPTPPGVVPGTSQACPCPNVCPFHSKHANGMSASTAGLRLVDMNPPQPKTDRLSALVASFLDGVIDEISDRVSLRVLAALEQQREFERTMQERDRAVVEIIRTFDESAVPYGGLHEASEPLVSDDGLSK